jgi:pentatricopeptide repeat protein
MPGIETFVLRFFEAVFQRLTKPAFIVLDNYQHIEAESLTHGIISRGFSILPQGVSAVVISREDAPPAFSRMLANRKMLPIGWDKVRLTLEETAGIVRLQKGGSISKRMTQRLHEAADGWAAGILLMLARTDLESIDWQKVNRFTPQEIIAYFAREVFEKESPETQDFLLKAAFLPYMTTSSAKSLTGYARAGQILAELNRKNRFTERRLRRRFFYQFHPLFRDFLMSRAELRHSEKELDDWCKKAAKILFEEGDPEGAADLFQDACAWDELAEIIMNRALIMIRQGRSQSLLQWLQALPEEIVVKKPWLRAWMGIALIQSDPETGRALLEKAFHAFRHQNDTVGLFLCWSFIIRAIFLKMEDFTPFDHWIQVLEELMDHYRQCPSSDIEGQVVVGMLLALVHRRLEYPRIAYWIERALVLLTSPVDSDTKVSIVNNTVHYYLLAGNYGEAGQIIDLLRPSSSDGYLDSKETVAVVAHSTISTFYYCYLGMHAKCIDAVYKGLRISNKTGFVILNNIIAGHGIWSALINDDYKTAKALLEENTASIKNARPLDRGLLDFVKSLNALQSGNLKQAEAFAASALKASIGVGSQFSTIFCHLLNARIIYRVGDHAAAYEHLDEAFNLSQRIRAKHLMFHSLTLKARFALTREHSEAGLQLLREALALGKEIGLYHNMIESRADVARLFTIALEHGIEPDYASNYIRKRGLTLDPPPLTVDSWPWPLKIYTLGRFSILKDGRPIRFSTKTQKKPLALVKVIIAGGGRDVSRATASDALWPDADGDKADRALTTTLHRLRRLLGHDPAVLTRNGKLDLNPSYCWVDCWALEDLLSMAEEAYRLKDLDTQMHLYEKAIAIYRGPFLDGELLEPWILSPRERLRSKFLRAGNQMGDALESTEQWGKASDCYRQILDVDDRSEETYQKLMRCLMKMGRTSEAMSVYERCRTILSAVFGLSPSSETRAIRRSLLDGRKKSPKKISPSNHRKN